MNTAPIPVDSARASGPGAWKIILLALPLIVATIFFILWRGELNRLASRPLNSYGTVPPFELINQSGTKFGSAQLEGRIWIADFIFTTCPGPCPIISTRMSELQKPLAGSDVRFVSFTVDPEKDTPEVLRVYAEKVNADSKRWDFLTGPKSAIYNLSTEGFKLGASDGTDEAGEPVHSTRFILVDRHRTIRGYYDALAVDGVTKLIADTRHLLREQPK